MISTFCYIKPYIFSVIKVMCVFVLTVCETIINWQSVFIFLEFGDYVFWKYKICLTCTTIVQKLKHALIHLFVEHCMVNIYINDWCTGMGIWQCIHYVSSYLTIIWSFLDCLASKLLICTNIVQNFLNP